MVNVSDEFIFTMKEAMVSQGLNPSDFVVCLFFKEKPKDETRYLETIFVPLRDFENNDLEEKNTLPFRPFLLIKRHGCWLVSDMSFFMSNTIRKLVIKDDKIAIETSPKTGVGSMVYFVGQCLIEHMANNKLSRKELVANIKTSHYKFNKIISGDFDLDLDLMCRISWELQGKNNKLEYKVLFEKYIDPTKRRRVDYNN